MHVNSWRIKLDKINYNHLIFITKGTFEKHQSHNNRGYVLNIELNKLNKFLLTSIQNQFVVVDMCDLNGIVKNIETMYSEEVTMLIVKEKKTWISQHSCQDGRQPSASNLMAMIALTRQSKYQNLICRHTPWNSVQGRGSTRRTRLWKKS